MRVTARLWFDYIREKRYSVLLYALTVLLFLTVAGLYQAKMAPKLFYAAELSAFFWILFGFIRGRKYVAKRKALLLLTNKREEQTDSCGSLSIDQDLLEAVEREILELGSGGMERDWMRAADLLEEEKVRCQTLAKERQTSQNDYYLMWAHQIKTPIAAMKLLLSGDGEPAGSVKENFLLKEELFKIEQYVEMVLHFQRLQSMEADLVLEEYDLDTLLKQAVRKYSVLFINKGVSLQLAGMHRSVLTDEKWFCFCIEQILSNSIKYTVKGEGVISIYMSEEKEDTLVIEDNGIGIRPEDLPRIFEKGFTGYNGRMDKKSTGIGLYLCKQILNRLNNEIWAESKEGSGTKIYLWLYDSKVSANLSKM